MPNPNQHLFKHCPACGQKALYPKSQKSFSCRACGFMVYINCASACIALIFNDKNELLVTRRKNDPAKGMLDLPGGFAEPGESIEQSLVREVKEELNLAVITLDYLCSFPNTYQFKDVIYPITDMAFVCKVDSFDGIQAGDDVLDFDFIDPETFETHRFGLESPKKVVQYYRRQIPSNI